MPTDIPAPKAVEISPRLAFLMTGMSERRGTEEDGAQEAGDAVVEELAIPGTREPRFALIEEVATGGVGNEARAAAAGGTLLEAAGTKPLRARRSWRVSDMPGRTDRFFERDIFGAIAVKESSDSECPERVRVV